MFRSVYVLGGDSESHDMLPEVQRQRLPSLFDEWSDVPLAPDIESRLAQLEALVPPLAHLVRGGG